MESHRLELLHKSMTPIAGRHGETRGSAAGDDNSDDDLDAFIAANDSSPQSTPAKYAKSRLFAAFLIFGLLNNVLYVIILSAALDLVSASTPKGIIALFNILPALLTKVAWPLLSSGQIQYTRRVLFCTLCSWLGIIIIALSTSLSPRLFGISLASLSSGLGELTFLQLTTTLPSRSSSRVGLGAWSSGTGAAGIVGAGLWWALRGLGVKWGLGISSFLPLFFPITYFVLLPAFSNFEEPSNAAYQPLSHEPSESHLRDEEEDVPLKDTDSSAYLTTSDKMTLLRPLLLRYMLPLFAVYVEEYVINTGIAPTLVFPLPSYGPWSRLFMSSRDYYPFWSLTYQSFVFLSRSSLSLGFPPIPRRLLPLPSIVQLGVLTTLYLQSSRFILASSDYTPPDDPSVRGIDRSITLVFLLMCLEGLCGGSAYVNTFWHVGREGEDDREGEEGVRRKMEKEFRIGATGAADSCGILFASLISMPLEISLCNTQIRKGRSLCRQPD